MADHITDVVVPLSPTLQKHLHNLAETNTFEENRRIFPTLFHSLTESTSWSTETAHHPKALTTFDLLTQSPHIASAIVSAPKWVCSTNGMDFTHATILGPFFAYQSIRPEVLFPLKDGKITVSHEEVARWDITFYYKCLAKILKSNFLMKSPEDWPLLREGVLDFFEGFLKRNREVKKTIANRDVCSPLHALMSLFGVLLELVEPIYNRPTVWKQLKVEYTLGTSRLNLPKDEPRIAADAEGVAKLLDKKLSENEQYTFSCVIFFLCLEAMDVCFVNSIKYSENLERHDIVMMTGRLNQIRMMGAGETVLKKAKEELNNLIRIVYSMKVVKTRMSALATSVVSFCEFTSKWILSIAGEIEKGLPPEPPEAWTVIPEYFVTNNCKAFSWFSGDVLQQMIGDTNDIPHLLSQLAFLMSSPAYVKNPYSRAAHVEALHSIISSSPDSPASRSLDLRSKVIFQAAASEYICENLMPNMMNAYVDLENLGGSNQFFEKFTYRYYVGVLIRHFYDEMVFRDAVLTCSKKSDVRFVKFFNMMLNDVNWLLSEGLKRVTKINEYEDMHTRPGEWAAMTSDARRSVEVGYNEAMEQCKPYMTLANEAMQLVSTLVRDTPSSFLQSALIGKVADVLNFFLIELGGDGVKRFKIKNPQKHDFQHGALLKMVVQMYVSLGGCPEHEGFERAVAEDERSYSPERFESVLEYLKRKASHLLLGDDAIEELSRTFEAIRKAHSELDQDDLEFPDSLVDPIMQCPLKDPVQLPKSNEWCERKVITQHLLNDFTNPFNRAPLTIEQLNEHNEKAEVKMKAVFVCVQANNCWYTSNY
eukprot:TRINITY_DN20230_c0_g1_i1.p1 TRINITY_DN20230_c0_g1~~TRINITY_DN20230_c0_g1_i1.p1  ORF type:complete len:851 (+),score=254.47 TRINITY_DN20230_c0_g1_i1:99-2555(+)